MGVGIAIIIAKQSATSNYTSEITSTILQIVSP
jgi:hypothetical protein